MQGRIWFEGNPWPDGHGVAAFEFAATAKPHGIGLILHLETEPYDERPVADEDDDAADWDAPGVWGNYGHGILSNRFWGIDPAAAPLLAATEDALSRVLQAGVTLHVDPGDGDGGDSEGHAFAIYLLGHDAVRDHRIAIRPAAGGLFDIDWSGAIALAYVGDWDYRHRFRATLREVPFAGLRPAQAAR